MRVSEKMENTGFGGDQFDADEKIPYVCLGKVIDRSDPDGLCRLRARIPGVMERSQWARPKGGGSKNEGVASVPPLGADVYITFVNGDPRMPVWERADYGVTENGKEVFAEHTDPDVHVIGLGPFRLVIDNRTSEDVTRFARAKLVKEINGQEEDIAWIEINEDNSIQVYASSAIGIEADAIINIDSPAVQIKGRKVMAVSRPIN